jgi:hypothetical protein
MTVSRSLPAIPRELREADPERDARCPTLEARIHAEPFAGEPGKFEVVETLRRGELFRDAGAWWYRPPWSGAGRDHEPAIELDVESRQDAERWARQYAAWLVAGGEL